MYEFRWNDWNVAHIADHGVTPEEAEWVTNHARPPFPADAGDGKTVVRGQSDTGRYLQVIYLLEPDDVVFVIHARALSEKEKSRLRRRRR